MNKNKSCNMPKEFGEGVGFERIRRITGYLVGTMDKWNDAKKAEEHDRVKHGATGRRPETRESHGFSREHFTTGGRSNGLV